VVWVSCGSRPQSIAERHDHFSPGAAEEEPHDLVPSVGMAALATSTKSTTSPTPESVRNRDDENGASGS
jgi:hypothetical protein